jgi:dihydrofolate reductase
LMPEDMPGDLGRPVRVSLRRFSPFYLQHRASSVAEAVAALKQEDGADLHVIGSTQLVQTLIEHDLVDEFRLMIDPVVVGGGKRIFGDDGVLRPLQLVDGQVTTTGTILATYAPEHRNEGDSRPVS